MNNFKKAGRFFTKKLPAKIEIKLFTSVGKLKDKIDKNKSIDIKTEDIPVLSLTDIRGINICEIEELLRFIPDYFSPFKTEFYILFLCESGQGTYTVETENISIGERQTLFILPNTRNQFHEPFSCKGKVIAFTAAVFTGEHRKVHFLHKIALWNTIEKSSSFFIKNRYEDILCLVDMMKKEVQNPYDHIQQQLIANYVFSILLIANEVLTIDECLFQKHDFQLVKKFKKSVYLEENKNQSIKYYAVLLNTSVVTLSKAFKKYEKITPKRWLINVIIQEIRQELTYGGLTVGELASKYGFEDSTNFTKFFKKHTGITPTEYKRNFKY